MYHLNFITTQRETNRNLLESLGSDDDEDEEDETSQLIEELKPTPSRFSNPLVGRLPNPLAGRLPNPMVSKNGASKVNIRFSFVSSRN